MMFLEIMSKGGPVMWVIFGCGLLAFFVFFEKVFQFHREEINVRELLHGLFNVLGRDGLVEAVTLCDNTPGPAARLLGAAITAYGRGDDDISQAIDEAALEELPKLENHIQLLGVLGYVLPLIGFLGTVLGMLEVFSSSAAGGGFSNGVYAALVTSCAGLALAIPCYLAHNYLVARVNAIALDMEKAAQEITGFFERRRAAGKNGEKADV